VSVGDGVRAPSHGVPAGGAAGRRARARQVSSGTPTVVGRRVALPWWSGYAWGAIGAAVAFIALTCWWLTQDRSIPIYDAGDHLEVAFRFHDMIQAGNLLGPFNYESPYPPLGALVGAIATFIGGVNVAAPIIGENVVFVPLLVLGCYQTGRLLFDARAGLLAAIFVLGSSLLIAQLHVFMLDAPETAAVAVAIWLLLASEDFGRIGVAALAGVAVGLGMLVKVQFAPFIVGIVLLALLRGGWRNRRGFAIFAVIALVIAVPWYLNHLAEFSTFTRDAGPHEGVPTGDAPATFTLANFAWYFWNILNAQFLAPLYALIVGGTIWLAATLLRRRPDRFGSRLEFFGGAIIAWLLITLTPAHDIRYGMPLMPYLAVIATGWIVYLPRHARLLAIAVLALGVSANTLGTTFGVGGTAQVKFVNPTPAGEELADTVTLYSNESLLVAGPRRDGDVPGLLVALRGNGVRTIAWSLEQSTQPDFSYEGLAPLARIAELAPAIGRGLEFSHSPQVATLVHEPVTAHSPPVCTTLSDGTGVWVVRYDSAARKLALYCPARRPRYYDVGGVG
jgi:4-amino-4-deoxy-L-arabinose transferase-like glycosyltransferase